MSETIHFVTVASRPHPGLERLQASALHFDLHLHVLGLGEPYPGNGKKLHAVAEFAARLPADDTIVYTDAYDSVFLASRSEFERALSVMDGDLLISAEQNLSLRGHPIFFPWQGWPTYVQYPDGPKPFRFLNAGTFVGKARRLAGLPDEVGVRPETASDQTVLSKYYCRCPERISLDHLHQLMSCNGGRIGMEDADYVWVDGRLLHRPTGNFPCILHVPGKNEESLARILRNGPFPNRHPSSEADITKYRKRALTQSFVSTIGVDNFLARFVFWNCVLALGLAVILKLFL